jgi:hypothetical protein
VSGIGDVLALTSALEIGDIHRCAAAGNFASYARMINGRHESNGKAKRVGNGKCGNKRLGGTFIDAAHHAVRYDSSIRRFCERSCAASRADVAVKAVAHRLARAFYRIMREADLGFDKAFSALIATVPAGWNGRLGAVPLQLRLGVGNWDAAATATGHVDLEKVERPEFAADQKPHTPWPYDAGTNLRFSKKPQRVLDVGVDLRGGYFAVAGPTYRFRAIVKDRFNTAEHAVPFAYALCRRSPSVSAPRGAGPLLHGPASSCMDSHRPRVSIESLERARRHCFNICSAIAACKAVGGCVEARDSGRATQFSRTECAARGDAGSESDVGVGSRTAVISGRARVVDGAAARRNDDRAPQ